MSRPSSSTVPSRILRITAPDTENNRESSSTPAHHATHGLARFRNPWLSYTNPVTPKSLVKAAWQFSPPVIPDNIATLIPVHKPLWGADPADKSKLKATWLGHASFMLELPTPPGASRGARILFDPVFSDRCFMVQFAGPKRYTINGLLEAPCQVEDLPEFDLVLISHNHYDHMDTNTLTKIARRQSVYVLSTLGNEYYWTTLAFAKGTVQCLDWWQDRIVDIALPAEDDPDKAVETQFMVTCVPAQHQANRGILDRNQSLWAGFVVTSVAEKRHPMEKDFKVYFTGDTGYRYVPDGAEEDDRNVCPAFKEIGEKFGGFDLAFLPIGAYLPREFMSSIHCAPQDAALIYRDVKAKRAIGMHWGTWVLTSEPVMEPPQKLREACQKLGIPDGHFVVSDLGETKTFDC
ncbi:N-acyl-phosphatidylethanolamine-hydrolyzing phospholipase D [Cantharellus anzutake]|uniref:N-acyl-phosphatidylethanolamine-hydrolyzing phospholipase D n=1 Tax=Cantharellus anzutake TaxID=1750568 RepID=UPI001904B966|nr:N-acyl-phosphatidylethanolamine-hydrolyzing phospholipase D [Cantharellus anzutake]KAF8331472.1 N-acyl-phosphatidylethanolamine-hydrolyzing phospholipase D [Cantharellus anzutake]